MAKKKKTKEGRKTIFDKVNVVFKNPIRADILNELSQTSQRPIDLADNIGVKKQTINYHLNALKAGGLVQVQRHEFKSSEEVSESFKEKDMKGARVNGVNSDGNIQVSYGVELTEDGRKVAKKFVNRLYKDSEVDSGKDNNNNK